jgi:hypothetical protein
MGLLNSFASPNVGHMPDDISANRIQGPVNLIDGKLTLKIPLEYGAGLVECSRGIGEVSDGHLVIIIEDWLAEKLGLVDGSIVIVQKLNGKFNLRKKPTDSSFEID